MLQESHYPSKWSVAIVFFVILLLIAGVFLWAFWINIGGIVLKSDVPFQVTFSGEEYSCDAGVCEFSLGPGVYDFLVSREGYFDQNLSLRADRFQTFQKNVDFVLIPYLRSVESLPNPQPDPYSLKAEGTEYVLMSQSDSQILSRFETLVSPELIVAGTSAFVLDRGRLFVVDLETGRKQRRFDDTVLIHSVLPSSRAERSLLFVTFEGTEQLWLYSHLTDELQVLPWTVDPSLLQWVSASDHLIYLITDQFEPVDGSSLISDLLESSQITAPTVAFYQYNLDTTEDTQLISFSSDRLALRLLRIQDRFFVEYRDGSFDELVLSQ